MVRPEIWGLSIKIEDSKINNIFNTFNPISIKGGSEKVELNIGNILSYAQDLNF